MALLLGVLGCSQNLYCQDNLVTRWKELQELQTTEAVIHVAVSRNLSAYIMYQDISRNYKVNPRYWDFNEMLQDVFPSCEQGVELDIQFLPSSITLSNSSYTVVEFLWSWMQKRFEYKGKQYGIVQEQHTNRFYSPLAERGLIAIDSNDNSKVLYLSGYMFLDNICEMYFPKGRLSDLSMREYILLRYYNYEPAIERVDSEKGECVFYSKVMRKKYRVQIIHEADEYEGKDDGVTYDEITELPEAEEKREGE